MARLLVDLKEYHRPDTAPDALDLLKKYGQEATLLAGGISLAFRSPKVSAAIDISRLPLRGTAWNAGDLEIGAVTTIREMEIDPAIQMYAGGLIVQACDRLATTPLRNLITCGGNLMGGFVWSDLPVALLALNASVRIFDGAESIRPIETDGRFQRDALLDKAAVSLRLQDDIMTNVRIACGGLVAQPQRIVEAEQVLEGARPTEKIMGKAGAAAAEVVVPRRDYNAGPEYRLSVLSMLIRRAVAQAVGGDSM